MRPQSLDIYTHISVSVRVFKFINAYIACAGANYYRGGDNDSHNQG